jgi:hypothetical protein
MRTGSFCISIYSCVLELVTEIQFDMFQVCVDKAKGVIEDDYKCDTVRSRKPKLGADEI